MIRNYLLITLRNIRRNFGFSMITIVGLAIGIASCLMIGLYVQHELSYESFHENRDHLYRYIPRSEREGELSAQVFTPPGLATFLVENFHEITHVTRMAEAATTPLFKQGDTIMPASAFSLADSSFFQMFSFPLIRGDVDKVLNRPLTVAISRRIAESHFPGEDPVGKVIQYDNAVFLEITGVFENLPANTHFHFDYLASFTSLPELMKAYGWDRPDWLTQMDAWNYDTYLMTSFTPIEDLQRRVNEKVFERLWNKPMAEGAVQHWLQPLREIHFTSGIKGDTGGTGNMEYVYVFSAIAVFVLLIAALNFVNLTTARAVKRAKEVAMRKTMGATRGQLVLQFLGETSLFVVVALVLAIQLLELTMTPFNRFMGMQLSFSVTGQTNFLLQALMLGCVVAVAAGSYPAFYLSSFQPAGALKLDRAGTGKSFMRQVLTVLQFGTASLLIIATLVVFRQMDFIRNTSLGFEKAQVVSFVPTSPIRQNFEPFKQRLLLQDGVEAVTLSNSIPGELYGHWAYKIPSVFGDKSISINTAIIDYDYLDVLGLELVEGRALSPEHATDAEQGYLINEAAVREYMLEEPVGTVIQTHNGLPEGTIVGVVKDYHWKSLHHPVEPLVLRIDPHNVWRASVRLAPGKTVAALEAIRKEWARVAPDYPFDYVFLDDYVDRLYKSEERVGILMTAFSGLAIFVACLGLLGLSSFMIEQRRKEVGIRKVMGASVQNIVRLLSWDFLRLVLTGFLLFLPLAWYAVHQWLENFAYKVTISPVLFLMAGCMVTLIAFFTVGFLSYRASVANPAETLKCE